MKHYKIMTFFVTHCVVDVTADSEEEAIEEAWMEAGKNDYNHELCLNCAHDFAEVLEEKD